MKLHLKYSLTVTVLIITIVLILSGILSFQYKTSMHEISRTSSETMEDKLLDQFKERGKIITLNLVENIINPLYKYDMETIYEITKAVKNEKDIKYIYIYDQKGRIIHDGTKTIALFNKVLNDEISKKTRESQKLLIQDLEDDVLDISSPIMLSDERLGGVRIGLSLKGMQSDIRNMIGHMNNINNKWIKHNFFTIISTALGLSLFGIVLAGFIGRNLSRPLVRLSNAVDRVAKGDLTNKVEVKSRDEIGSLATSFNKMTRDLQQTTVSRDDLIKEIEMRKKTEGRVRSFAHILEESLNEIYIFDAKTLRFIQVNKGARLNLGYSMEEISGLTPLDLKPEFTAESFTKMVEPLRKDGTQKIQFETVHQRKDGSLYDVEVHLQLSAFQSVSAFVAIILDITERKQVEKRLKDSEKKNRALLEYSPICTKIVDLDFNLKYMSAAGIKALKIDDVTKLYGKPYPFDFFPESFKNSMTKNLEKVKETGEIITEEAPLADIDGNELWFRATLVPVKDDEGRIDYIIIVSINTTERKKSEAMLQKLFHAVEQGPSVVVVTDNKGNIEYVNSKFSQLTGYTLEEAMGKNPRFLKSGNIHPGSIQRVMGDYHLWE